MVKRLLETCTFLINCLSRVDDVEGYVEDGDDEVSLLGLSRVERKVQNPLELGSYLSLLVPFQATY